MTIFALLFILSLGIVSLHIEAAPFIDSAAGIDSRPGLPDILHPLVLGVLPAVVHAVQQVRSHDLPGPGPGVGEPDRTGNPKTHIVGLEDRAGG